MSSRLDAFEAALSALSARFGEPADLRRFPHVGSAVCLWRGPCAQVGVVLQVGARVALRVHAHVGEARTSWDVTDPEATAEAAWSWLLLALAAREGRR